MLNNFRSNPSAFTLGDEKGTDFLRSITNIWKRDKRIIYIAVILENF